MPRRANQKHHSKLDYREEGDPVVQLHVERTIAAPPDRVFDWLAEPAHLGAAPLVIKAGYAKGSSGAGVGALREVIGVGAWFREEITAYDPPRSYSYPILRAFPAFDHEGAIEPDRIQTRCHDEDARASGFATTKQVETAGLVGAASDPYRHSKRGISRCVTG
jgi:hypothetical protein